MESLFVLLKNNGATVVNHKDYVAKIGDDHKFPINKFGELAKYLIDRKVVNKFYNPVACSF
jgi:hypothetical protein